jgi:hypothetical protein
MALILSATPFGLRHRLARATKTDMLMLNADTDARAGHESRAIRAEARSVVCSRGCQCGRAITVKKSRK